MGRLLKVLSASPEPPPETWPWLSGVQPSDQLIVSTGLGTWTSTVNDDGTRTPWEVLGEPPPPPDPDQVTRFDAGA